MNDSFMSNPKPFVFPHKTGELLHPHHPSPSPLSVAQWRLLGPLGLLLLLLAARLTAQCWATGEGQQQAACQRKSQCTGAHLPAVSCWGGTQEGRRWKRLRRETAEKQPRVLTRPQQWTEGHFSLGSSGVSPTHSPHLHILVHVNSHTLTCNMPTHSPALTQAHTAQS